ncbi:MAG TPA: GTP 3',8-cyclase MoaA, partial [Nitrospirota bacterium]
MPLMDAHQRFIDYLRISVTDRCNLSCVYCKPRAEMKALSHRGILSYEEILRIVAMAAPLGISHIRLTGGEPLIRRGIIEFIASLKASSGVEDISLTTNGIMLAELAGKIREAGVSRLNISLDTLDQRKFQTITGSDAWSRVWTGIRSAEEFGFNPIKINMVPIRGVNDGEIIDFARLTLARGLHVRFIELMPLGDRDRLRAEQCIPSSQVRSLIEREFGVLAPFSRGGSAGPSDNYQIAGARGVVGFISPISKHFCGTCRRLRLTADGKIRPCLLSDTEID